MKKYVKIIILTLLFQIFILTHIPSYADLNFNELEKHELYREDFGNYSQDSLSNGMKKYSNEYFSISIPSNYVQVSDFSFTNEDSNNINIQISEFLDNDKNPYTEEVLNELVKGIYSNFEDYKTGIVEGMKAEYGDYLSDSEIAEYVDTLKCNFIDTKEITTFTDNNYKCFHFIVNYTMADYNYYANQYLVVSGNNLFTLTIGADDKEEFESYRIHDVIDSFTIYNYQEPSDDFEIFSSDVIDSAITNFITVIFIGVIAGIISHFNKKAKKEKTDYNEAFDEDDEVINNKK